MDKHHIILKGASGNGKTYLACALGHAACRKFRSVKYIRMPELLDELNAAKACGTFCTQYEPDEWYDRINPDPNVESPISEAIMDRIIHNSYEVLIEGKVSMRERHGLKASLKGGRP